MLFDNSVVSKMSFSVSRLLPHLHRLTLLPHLRHEGQESTPGCYSPYLHYTAPTHEQEQGHTDSHTVTGNKLLMQHKLHLKALPKNDISVKGALVLTSMTAT